MTAFDTLIAANLEAIAVLLLGERDIGTGLSLLGGRATAPINIAHMARVSDDDLIYLAFDETNPLAVPDITLAVPRAPFCHVKPGCRLYLAEGAKRALILPPQGARGHYQVRPREIVHVDRMPADIEAGVARAQERLDALLRQGATVGKQTAIYMLPHAA